MANTTNYNWETPDDTDLVKDGAAAIRTLGNSVDTTTKALNPETTLGDIAYRSATSNTNTRLPIGTSGQILSVSGGVPAWINNDQGDITEVQAGVGISVASGTGPIPIITNSSTDLITTAGDLLYGTAADTVARLGIGTAGQVLKVNSGATAPEWGTAAAGGGMTLLSTTSITQTSSITVSSISGSYTNLMIIVENFKAVNDNTTVLLRFNSDTGSNYGWNIRGNNSGNVSGVTSIEPAGGAGLDNSNNSSTMTLSIPLYASTAAFKSGLINVGLQQNDGYWLAYSGGFGYKSTSAISSFTLLTGGGDFAAQGTIKIYGVN
jgi:hypothetical protein